MTKLSIEAGVQIKPYFAGDTVFSPRGESKKFKAKKPKKKGSVKVAVDWGALATRIQRVLLSILLLKSPDNYTKAFCKMSALCRTFECFSCAVLSEFCTSVQHT